MKQVLARQDSTRNTPLILYCIMIASTLLHMGGRVPLLGILRIDMLLTAATAIAIWQAKNSKSARQTEPPASIEQKATKQILILLGFIVFTISSSSGPAAWSSSAWNRSSRR